LLGQSLQISLVAILVSLELGLPEFGIARWLSSDRAARRVVLVPKASVDEYHLAP